MPSHAPQAARPPRPSRRKWPGRAALALLGLAALDGLAWQAAQHELGRMVADWSTQLRRQGWTPAPGQTARGGSFLTARLTLHNPRLNGPAGNRTIVWGADRITLSLSLLHPLTVRIGLDGTQAARLTGPDTDQALRLQAEDARLFLPLGLPADAPTGHATWAARSLTLQILNPDGHTTDLTLHDLRGHGLWNGQASPDSSRVALTTHAATIDLPPTWPLPTAPTDAHRLSDAGLTVSFPGGTAIPLLVQDLHARWTHLSLSAVGTAHLAAPGGAEGAFTLSIAGIGQTVRTLDHAGTLSPDLTRLVTAIDQLAAGSPNAITAPATPDAPALTDRPISLPLRLNAGMVFIGALPLGHITDWLR
ncbi:DUF2125 domain-containing protein [Gluconacetobacter sp. Hr-1-5]|uniref:DUF2125 domain-containing protein n=1 Tax=Gluconacetobacter sp. Hr-1-5 TaxID=3395370 RepID=UPI003B51FDE5